MSLKVAESGAVTAPDVAAACCGSAKSSSKPSLAGSAKSQSVQGGGDDEVVLDPDTDLVISLPHSPSGLSKATWTDADFPSMGGMTAGSMR
ncbi:hypothetical protein ACFYPX_25075 [Micromonospora zamorensis]|uniref:hypothetical protein n=1 Tax=Micromonospora zamorensis TaxID=709883 RepID=UPI0036825A79